MQRLVLFLIAAPAFAQTGAALVAEAQAVSWERPYVSAPGCTAHVPVQAEVYATTVWTHHCVERRRGIVRESFYYVFGEPARTALLRVDLRPENDTQLAEAQAELTRRFGQPEHAPEMFEIGFRRLRFGQPIAGDRWKHGQVHYLLHANRGYAAPLGVRTGVQLILLHDRLFAERLHDDLILKVDGLGGFDTLSKPADPLVLMRQASSGTDEDRARQLLDADAAVRQLSMKLSDAEAEPVRRGLARYGVRLGGQTHQGGLDYRSDLLWRVWREFPGTEAGERAFLELQHRGWNTDSGEGCPANPDLFRTVIERGEDFLAARPASRVRKEVLYSVAVAYESWWSIGRAAKDDPIVSAPPYPRRESNARMAAGAREKAIAYYREVVRLAPGSSEAASALRRLPRLELGIDTGQRRFFCSYC